MEQDDPLLAAIVEVERTGQNAQEQIGEGVAIVRLIAEAREEGKFFPEIWQESLAAQHPAKRRQVASALEAFDRAVRVFRATVIKELVDEHGWTFTQVARDVGTSRQMASRLYNDLKNQ